MTTSSSTSIRTQIQLTGGPPASSPCDVPRGPARRTVPVQALHEPARGGAVRARLDHLARWRAAFLRLWRTALTASRSQLLPILRGRSHLLAITGSALTVNVPVAARTLLNATALRMTRTPATPSDGFGREADYYQILAYTNALNVPGGMLIAEHRSATSVRVAAAS